MLSLSSANVTLMEPPSEVIDLLKIKDTGRVYNYNVKYIRNRNSCFYLAVQDGYYRDQRFLRSNAMTERSETLVEDVGNLVARYVRLIPLGI